MSENLMAILLQKAKVALRVVSSAFDGEINDLIQAGIQNITTRGVTVSETEDGLEPMVLRALLTYVRMNFGQPDDYDRLKAAYDEQLGQLMTTTGFTTWGAGDGSE